MKHFFITSIIVLFGVIAHAQTKLEYKLKPNDVYSYASSTKSKQTITMMGNENTTSANATSTLNIQVQSVDASGIVAKVTPGEQTIDVKGMGMMGMADTTLTVKNEDVYETITFTTDGNVKSQVSEKGKSANIRTPAARIASQVASGGALSKMLILDYTGSKLEKGASWTKQMNDTNKMGENGEGGKIITTSSMKYTFDGMVDTLGMKCARILIRSEKLIIDGTVMQMGNELSMAGDGIVKGVGYVELATGMQVSSQVKTELDQRLSMTQPMQMEIPMAIDVDATFSRVMASKQPPAKKK
ncbi:MAG: hypothetical protein JNL32_02940 [Candidatus Kapabacteria bacterium]|nr:hypothetical protein [Candidatus Kapabacteria bacterium]